MSMLVLAAFLAAGFAVGKFVRLPKGTGRAAGYALSVCLFALVFLLGIKLGGDRSLLARLDSIGAGALGMAVACTAGSILAVCAYLAVRKLVRGKRP